MSVCKQLVSLHRGSKLLTQEMLPHPNFNISPQVLWQLSASCDLTCSYNGAHYMFASELLQDVSITPIYQDCDTI